MKKFFYLSTIALCFMASAVNGQNFLFQKTVGTVSRDTVIDFKKLNATSYILLGEMTSAANDSVIAFVSRLDTGFNVVWQQQIKYATKTSAKNLTILRNGDFIVSGGTGNAGAWVLKMTAAGTTVWSKNCSTFANSDEQITDVIEKADNSLLYVMTSVSGYSTIVKATSNGGLIGTTQIKNNGNFIFFKSGNAALNGSVLNLYGNFVNQTTNLIGLNDAGNLAFSNEFTHNTTALTVSDLAVEAGYLYASGSNLNGANRAQECIKYDTAGRVIWKYAFNAGGGGGGGAAVFRGAYNSLAVSGNAIYLVGYGNNGTSNYACLTKLDTAGTQLWTKFYGAGTGESFNKVVVNGDGTVVMVGTTSVYGPNGSGKNIYVVKADAELGDAACLTTAGTFARSNVNITEATFVGTLQSISVSSTGPAVAMGNPVLETAPLCYVAACSRPNIPMLTTTGDSCTNFPVTTVPTLRWTRTGTRSLVTVEKYPFGAANVVWTNCSRDTFATPTLTMAPGDLYRWQVQSGNDTCSDTRCFSTASAYRYFAMRPTLSSTATTVCPYGGDTMHLILTGPVVGAGARWYRNDTLIVGGGGGGANGLSYIPTTNGVFRATIVYSNVASGCATTSLSSTNTITLTPTSNILYPTMRTLVDSGCPTARLRMTSTLTNAGAGAAIAWRLLPQPQTVGTGNVFRTTNARNGQQYVARLTVAAGICANPRNINDTITITCVANATHEIDGLQRFDVYPNPAKDGNFNVNLMLQEMQTVGVSVFNTLGQKVWFNAPTPQVGSIEIPVQLPQVAKGLYLVEINANGKIATQRILIE